MNLIDKVIKTESLQFNKIFIKKIVLLALLLGGTSFYNKIYMYNKKY